jgi:hypothetical protein
LLHSLLHNDLRMASNDLDRDGWSIAVAAVSA